jgi:3-hydroxyacyl-[acyl-carrier-protein] dehydratase
VLQSADRPRFAAGARLPLAVPAGGALFAGHFPGRPILPGVALLDLALRALAAAGAPAGLREVVSLRLRRPVGPGEELEVTVTALEGEGRVRFEVRRDGVAVADAVVVLGEAVAAAIEGVARPSLAAVAGPGRPVAGADDLDALLPHRPPMRFLTAVEEERDGGAVCAASVPEGSAFDEGGWAPALVAVEMAAQAAAAGEALGRRRAGGRGARLGYLVRVRGVRFARTRVAVAATFRASVHPASAVPPLSTYAFEVGDSAGVVAAGTFSTWLTATDA